MKHYLYHWVPHDMEGDTLYPLNQLQSMYPKLYAEKFGKYIGREEITKLVLPTLGCLWNDVLHFTAVHPKVLKNALIAAGDNRKPKVQCYEIDPELLDAKNTIVFLYKESDLLTNMNSDNVAVYNPSEIRKYSELPQVTLDYFKESYEKYNREPLWLHRVPHILYKGSLNIKDLPIIEV